MWSEVTRGRIEVISGQVMQKKVRFQTFNKNFYPFESNRTKNKFRKRAPDQTLISLRQSDAKFLLQPLLSSFQISAKPELRVVLNKIIFYLWRFKIFFLTKTFLSGLSSMLPVHVSTIFGHGGGLAIKQEESDEDEELTECLTAWKLRRILQLISLMTSFSGKEIFEIIFFHFL